MKIIRIYSCVNCPYCKYDNPTNPINKWHCLELDKPVDKRTIDKDCPLEGGEFDEDGVWVD